MEDGIFRSQTRIQIICSTIIIIFYSIWYTRNRLILENKELNINEHLFFIQRWTKEYINMKMIDNESTKSENMPKSISLGQLPISLVGGNHIYMYTFKQRRLACHQNICLAIMLVDRKIYQVGLSIKDCTYNMTGCILLAI